MIQVAAGVLVILLGGGQAAVVVTGPAAERTVASWAAAEIRERRVAESEPVVSHVGAPEVRAVTVPSPHPCDQIPVPGPGPVLLTAATMSHCEAIAPAFDPPDLFRALVTIECESNGDPYANDHWIGKVGNPPAGLFSILASWEPTARSVLGGWAPKDPAWSAWFASWLVYHTGGGWHHWDACNGIGVAETVARYRG